MALVHGCALWLHLEGDENWMGRARQGAGSSEQWRWQAAGCCPTGPASPTPGPRHGRTCHSKLDMGTDLALQPIGGDASVVAGIIAGHPGEVQGPGIVCHPLWEVAPICRDNKGKLWDHPKLRRWMAFPSATHLSSQTVITPNDPQSPNS